MTKNGAIYLSKLPSTFPIIRNRYENAKEIDICLTVDEKVVNWRMTDEGKEEVKGDKIDLEIEKNLFYLAANRTGTEAISSVLSEAKSGIHREYLMGTCYRIRYEVYKKRLEADSVSIL